MNTIRLFFTIFIFVVYNFQVFANEKLYIDGNTLFYNTDLAKKQVNAEINWDDADLIYKILLENTTITTIQLNSGGGLIAAARYISDIVIDFELDTYVSGECSSACVDIFLAGNKRVLQKGSWLGFHKGSWAASDMKNYYEFKKEEEGWSNPFEFSSWLYEDTQEEILRQMKYMLERGVQANFIIETLRADNEGMWYPRRKQLKEAGVITE